MRTSTARLAVLVLPFLAAAALDPPALALADEADASAGALDLPGFALADEADASAGAQKKAPPDPAAPEMQRAELRDILGATHVAGTYRLKEGDFLLEGVDQIIALGSRVVMLYLSRPAGDDPHGSRWTEAKSLVEMAKLPAYREVFSRPVNANDDVRGFWLLRPDGTKAWAWEYLSARIAGKPRPGEAEPTEEP